MPPLQDKSLHVASLFVPEIKELLSARDFMGIKRLLKNISSVDLAGDWKNFAPSEKTLLFRLMSDRDASTLFEELEPEDQAHLLNTLGDAELESIIGDMTPEEAARIFRRLPERTVKSLSRLMEVDKQEVIQEIMKFPKNSIGHWMHIQRVALSHSLTSSQAIEKIKRVTRLGKGGDPDGYYVTDKAGKPIGYVSLRELIAAPSRTKIADYMSSVRLLLLQAKNDQKDAIQLFTKYQLSMAPVVDEKEKFLGYIQAEDILPLAQKESTEDIQKMGATAALEVPYFQVSYATMIRKRIPWLFVLFMGQLLTATAMSFFKDALDKALVLALFIPLIISSGGNCGSQAATLIVRALALKEVTFRDWWKVVYREFGMGLTLGIFLGTLGFFRVYLEGSLSHGYGGSPFPMALTVGFALLLIVLWGTMSGSLLPIFLHKLGFDPAVVSAPFVATLVDVTGLLIYFGTATVILRGTLL